MRLETARILRYGIAPALMAGLTALGCSATAGDDADTSDSELNARAPDATGMGPLATTSAEYKFASSVDPDVLTDRHTELWAQVYRPAELNATGKHPLVVFLHGNHGTCGRGENPRIDNNSQYTMQGTCPPGYVVVPNHLGYSYLATRLASWGYIVVSINANRGITAGGGVTGDFGLNLARGRLVLKHLQKLSEWNAEAGTTPSSLGFDMAGLIDFENVGMMGHSRGGEGVRAAYNQYFDSGSPWPERIKSPVGFKGIFEIGPVDGQTGRTLNALGTAWNVLLPMCDGDVSDLQGMKPFDRMLGATTETAATPKSMFAVYGTNHNFYNTEWQTSDSRGCSGHAPIFAPTGQIGSEAQRATGMHSLLAFFRAYVGKNRERAFNQTFDTRFQVPETLEAITRIERSYADAIHPDQVIALEDFSAAAGTSQAGLPIVAQNATLNHGSVPGHDRTYRGGAVAWTQGGPDSFLEIPFAAEGAGVDASKMMTFDMRISPQARTGSGSTATSFSIQLVNADGSLSGAVKLKDYLELLPNGGHIVLQTARVPVTDFPGANLAAVRGVRFVFDDSPQGSVYLASLRFSRAPAPAATPTIGDLLPTGGDDRAGETVTFETGNSIAAIHPNASNEIEVELVAESGFPVMDALPALRVGDRTVVLSRYADDGDTHKMVFRMTPEEFQASPDNATVKVRYGLERASYEWNFGRLDKSRLAR